MPNTCHICGISFNSYGDYHEHKTLGHQDIGLESNARDLKTHSTGRLDLGKQTYKPMAKEAKAIVVAKGEARLGKENFYGI